MSPQLRFYDPLLRERLSGARTVLVSGPRQVGKTTLCGALAAKHLDWTNIADRLVILRGPAAVIQHLGLERTRERGAVVLIDNLHGHRNWKGFLRKLSARCGPGLCFVATTLEAAALPRGGQPASALRLNPWSVGECARTVPTGSPIKAPAAISDDDWVALLEHGGFPEPFKKRDPRFTRRWNARHWEELIDGDLPQCAPVRDPAILQMLALLLANRSARALIYSELSRELEVTVDTIRRWLDLLERLHLGFRVRPWFQGVPKALRKEPKWFLRDWSGVLEPRARALTLIACHLLKAAEGWTDLGFGRFELRYVRDKAKREVDFLMLRDRKPWFLVDVSNEERVSPSLGYFQRCTRARHAFHVRLDAPYTPTDCFAQTEPTVVSARTLLSQLL
jgi:predicted AAA+ superfamily ATPase